MRTSEKSNNYKFIIGRVELSLNEQTFNFTMVPALFPSSNCANYYLYFFSFNSKFSTDVKCINRMECNAVFADKMPEKYFCMM